MTHDRTREEAIAYGKRVIKAGLYDETQAFWETAVKSLEQEPAVAQERYEDLCEYFGGAKDILDNGEDFRAWLERIKWHIRKAEELYEKYEQEQCSDAVSRQAVTKVIQSMPNNNPSNWYTCDVIDREDTLDEIEELPPVTPQPCEDYISRQAVEDAIYDASRAMDLNYEQLVGYIDKILPASPQSKNEKV